MANKMQAGVTFDPDVWEQFKKKYAGSSASERLEQLMRWDLDLDLTDDSFPTTTTFTANSIGSFSFNLGDWNANVNLGQLQVNNTSYASGSGTDVVQVYAQSTTTGKKK